MKFAHWATAVGALSLVTVFAHSYATAADISVVEPPAQAQANQSIPAVDEAVRLLRAGDPKRALEKLTEVKAEHPEFPEPRTILAQLYLSGNQLAPARQELERAVIDNPDAPEPYLLFGELAIREQRLTDAQCLLDRAWTISQAFNDNPERKKASSIRSQAGLATVAEQRGQWQQAIDHLTAWEKLDSKNGIVHQRLGRALFQLKKYKPAFAELQRAAKEEKKLLPAEIVMGQLYQAAGDHKIASQYMSQAVKNLPDDLPTRLATAEWALQTNELAKAKAEAEVITKLDSDAVTTNLLRGSIARVERKLPEAERFFEAAHLKSPGNFAAANNLALVLIEQPEEAKHQAALDYATQNAAKYQQNPEAWSTLAWVYFRLERYSEAEQAMDRALSARTLNPDSAFFLGTMLERRGKLHDAQAVLEQALGTPEAFAYRSEVTKLLAKLKQEIASAQDKAADGKTGGDPLGDDTADGQPAAAEAPPKNSKPPVKPAPKAAPRPS